MTETTKTRQAVPVWDIAIRAFHWLLVAAVAAAAATGFLGGMPALRTHLFAGVAVAALLAARAVWGLLGPGSARFASFAYGPAAVLAHLRALRRGTAARYLGHNPLGAQMVFALLLVLTALVASGLLALGGAFKQGPLASMRFAAGWRALAVHRALAIGVLTLVAAHVAGVAFESFRDGENLVRAMATGRKRAGPAFDAEPIVVVVSRPRLAVLLLAALGVAVAALLVQAPAAEGLPPATLDPTYDADCGSCHYAFSPSLNPGWVWTGILDHLNRHFGVAAPVPPADLAAIKRYVLTNAAEHWDTLPSHLFRVRDPADPWRVTATPYWRRVHAGIPAALFRTAAVSGRLSCNSCHADAASGRFAPQAIAVPTLRIKSGGS